MVLKNPIIIDSFAYRNPLRIYEILESIDQMSTDFFLENLEKLDEDENIGDQIFDLFYFKKRLTGSFQYHLFPEINLRLIENEKLMAIQDRGVYIK